MNKEAMARMSADELDEYGRVLGIEMRPAKTAAQKAALINAKRDRTATVTALGMQFEVPMKALSDKRVVDVLANVNRTDEDVYRTLGVMLGEQMGELVDAVTDEDGTVDSAALALAFVRIVTSDELKNC
ncbi:hypothetical protein [Eggerthella sp. AM16-19]|uniref:hypothetical protein n=1 Tax=Eggerthella sp. AM16-19 TaxID=2292042 RepID=UPI0011C212B9|nr:hypothetical protein [Eggerthella sp. AM16-19]